MKIDIMEKNTRQLRFMNDSIRYETVLLRGDCNVPLENGSVADNSRIVALLPTIRALLGNSNKVILASHLGRPKRPDQSLSMLIVANQLAKLMPDVHIIFCADEEPYVLCNIINDMEFGRSLLVIENLRFYEGETTNDPVFARSLSSMATVFVNDAFGCLHRKHASIIGVTSFLPSYAGLLIKKELSQIDKILNHNSGPSMAIIGGSKISTKAPTLKNMLNTMSKIALGGGVLNFVLKIRGYNIGKSIIEELDDPALVNSINEHVEKIIIPTDVMVTKDLSGPTLSFQHINIDAIEEDDIIVDLGSETTGAITAALRDVSLVIWSGPLGLFEQKPFDMCSVAVAREIASLTAQNKIHSVIGGGDVVRLITMNSLAQSFSHVSTGGGALLEILSDGDRFPGLQVLRDSI